MAKFFNFYKNSGGLIKLIFLGVALVMCVLWIIGSLTKIDRLVMFMVGSIVGGILVNIFLYDYVSNAVKYISKLF